MHSGNLAANSFFIGCCSNTPELPMGKFMSVATSNASPNNDPVAHLVNLGQTLTSKYIKSSEAHEVLNFDANEYPKRAAAAGFLSSGGYRIILCLVTLMNWVVMIRETDARARDRTAHWEAVKNMQTFVPQVPLIQTIFQSFTLVLFAADSGLRLFVDRGEFFHDTTNVLDFSVFLADVALLFAQPLLDVTFVASLRLFRVLRVVRFFGTHRLREVYLMLEGLRAALRPIFFAVLLIFMCLVFWGTIAVEFLHMDNLRLVDSGAYGDCPDYICKDAFASVFGAVLTFFKTIIAGDSWGQLSLPLTQKNPFHFLVLAGALLMIQVGLMNLIVAIIVDRAAEARMHDDELLLAQKRENFFIAYHKLKALFDKMDADGGGTLSVEELREAYHKFPEFQQILDTLDIREQELDVVFEILDANKDSEISFEEFVETLHDLKERNPLTLLTYIRHHTMQLVELVEKSQHASQKMAKQVHKDMDKMVRHFSTLDERVDDAVRSKTCPPSVDPVRLSTLDEQVDDAVRSKVALSLDLRALIRMHMQEVSVILEKEKQAVVYDQHPTDDTSEAEFAMSEMDSLSTCGTADFAGDVTESLKGQIVEQGNDDIHPVSQPFMGQNFAEEARQESRGLSSIPDVLECAAPLCKNDSSLNSKEEGQECGSTGEAPCRTSRTSSARDLSGQGQSRADLESGLSTHAVAPQASIPPQSRSSVGVVVAVLGTASEEDSGEGKRHTASATPAMDVSSRPLASMWRRLKD